MLRVCSFVYSCVYTYNTFLVFGVRISSQSHKSAKLYVQIVWNRDHHKYCNAIHNNKMGILVLHVLASVIV